MQVVCVCVLLVLAVLAVFGRTAHSEFVAYDDDQYVYENPVVQRGLSLKSIGWAFTHTQVGNWIPLTALSHMLDCQMFGLHAGGHHLVNVLWHAANAVLLFLVLRHLTGSLWRSAFVAALFAVHPLRAESVAWVSERKDVLSGFFFLLAIGAYAGYVEKRRATSFASSFGTPTECGKAAEDGERGKGKLFYALVVVFFTLGLLAKSMVATLPFVLLLLDYWPLGRMRGSQRSEVRSQKTDGGEQRYPSVPFWRLVREKVPLFLLSIGACVATASVPGLVLANAERLPLLERMGNAVVSYVVYLRQMIFPAGLATPYPIVPGGQPYWKVCLAMMLLAAISAAVVTWRKTRPWLLTGWLWYLGMLFPVIGIVQISSDAGHADRYTYLPEIGLAAAGIWAVAEWCARWEGRRVVLGGLGAGVVCALGVWGYHQTSYWRSSKTLWTRALACTSGNSVAHNALGLVFIKDGKTAEAIQEFRKALSIKPDYIAALNNLGNVFANDGKVEEAVQAYQKALAVKPDDLSVLNDFGVLLAKDGKLEEAIAEYRKALKINPDFAEAHLNLGIALGHNGQREESIEQYRKALKIQPGYTEAWGNLGVALFSMGEKEQAIACYRKALEIDPTYVDAEYNLGYALALEGKTEEAIAQYRKALEIKPDYAFAFNGLGAAFYGKEEWDESIAQYRKALEIKPDFTAARRGLDKALLRKGEFDEVMARFNRTAASSPDLLTKWCNLGNDYLQTGNLDKAILCYRQATKANPRSADACANLGLASFQKGEIREAIDAWQRSLEINPDQPSVQNNLAWLLATTPDASLRNGAKAVALAEQASHSDAGGNPVVLHTLAAAYAEMGRYGDAVATARRALEIAAAQKNDDLNAKLPMEIILYQADRPLRDAPP